MYFFHYRQEFADGQMAPALLRHVPELNKGLAPGFRRGTAIE
jgi:hypothetical protein